MSNFTLHVYFMTLFLEGTIVSFLIAQVDIHFSVNYFFISLLLHNTHYKVILKTKLIT